MIDIIEYHKGETMYNGRHSVFQNYSDARDFDFIYSYNNDDDIDYPYFSVEGEPLEAYYEVNEFS